MASGAEDDLLASLAIRRQIDRYMSAIDRRDFDAVADCFTDDAEIFMHVRDGDLSKAEFHRGGASFAKAVRRLERFKATIHSLANAVIEVNGSAAKADCRVTAWLMGEVDGSERVFLRGVHVIEDFALTASGWKISRRIHMPQIQCELPATPVQMPHGHPSNPPARS
jgi:ketosteroid isomerase-like protein